MIQTPKQTKIAQTQKLPQQVKQSLKYGFQKENAYNIIEFEETEVIKDQFEFTKQECKEITQSIFKKYRGQSVPRKEREIIVKINQGLVHSLAKKQYSYKKKDLIEYEDLLQCGNIGLIKAIDKYDISNPNGAKFFSYAFWWVKSEIQRFRHNHAALIRIPVGKRGKGYDKIVYSIDKYNYQYAYNEDQLKIEEQQKEFHKLLDEAPLTERDLQIIKMKYGIDTEKIPITEISQKLGISTTRINQKMPSMLNKIKKYLTVNKIYQVSDIIDDE